MKLVPAHKRPNCRVGDDGIDDLPTGPADLWTLKPGNYRFPFGDGRELQIGFLRYRGGTGHYQKVSLGVVRNLRLNTKVHV